MPMEPEHDLLFNHHFFTQQNEQLYKQTLSPTVLTDPLQELLSKQRDQQDKIRQAIMNQQLMLERKES